MKRAITAAAFFAALLVVWHVLVRANPKTAVLLPPPVEVWHYLVSAVQDRTIFEALWVTTKRLLTATSQAWRSGFRSLADRAVPLGERHNRGARAGLANAA
jgi:ABC-type nitrate/sulfonate/bicarbonate transport system permease component